MNTYKAVMYFDLDGTLLDQHSLLNQDSKDLVESLRNDNVLVVIASGRAPFEIEAMIQDTAIDTYISLNGHYAQSQGVSIAASAFDKTMIDAFVNFAHALDNPVTFYGSKTNALTFVDAVVEHLYAFDHAPLPAQDPSFFETNDVYMLYLFNDKPEKDVLYRDAFSDVFDFVRDTPYTLAVTYKGVSKKKGIIDLTKHLNLDGVPSFAFGDGMNDLEMFSAVDTSIAMGNAHETLKQHASLVTSNHDEGGIRKALLNLGFLGVIQD